MVLGLTSSVSGLVLFESPRGLRGCLGPACPRVPVKMQVRSNLGTKLVPLNIQDCCTFFGILSFGADDGSVEYKVPTRGFFTIEVTNRRR